MRISEVAAGAGVNIQTLRYYERRGLVPAPPRLNAGYRDYDPETVVRVRFIKRAQDVGFSLEEIRELLELRNGRRNPEAVRDLAVTKIRDIDERMRRLAAMRGALNELVDACSCTGAVRACPIIEALDDDPAADRLTGGRGSQSAPSSHVLPAKVSGIVRSPTP